VCDERYIEQIPAHAGIVDHPESAVFQFIMEIEAKPIFD
jgi:hypothetical protein